MLFREHLCARFWRGLGLQSCWGSGVSQPCPTVLHRAFPWYWPVHPDIYGFAFYAFYALHCLLFSSSEDAISRASLRTLLAPPWASILLGIRCFATTLRTLLAPPWASILLGIRCFATMPHSTPQGFSMVLAGPSRHLWLCLVCRVSIQTSMALPYMPCICLPCVCIALLLVLPCYYIALSLYVLYCSMYCNI